MKFSDFSIRIKLIVLLGATSAIALLISAVMSLSLTFVAQRNESLRHLQQMSDVARENLTAALAFRDNASAARMLGSLSANPRIMAAIIHDDEARQFSAFVAPAANQGSVARYLAEVAQLATRKQQQLFEQRVGLESIEFDYMYVVTPIVLEGKTLGTLTLLSDNQALKERISSFVLMQILISVLTLAIIVLISIRLQKVFTAPIFHIIDAIRKIAETKNYAVSVETIQNDEFKVLYHHFNDMIAQIRERDALLSRLATTDPLTGLANRRHAMEVLQTLVTRALRKQEFFGLIMFDIDYFKRINDQFGHPVGDLVLKEVAAILLHGAREYDLVARIGGEEFLLLCDHSDPQTTHLIAERMRLAIEANVITIDSGKTLRITASAGVYAVVPASDDLDAPLRCVDAALYHAKETGRNQVLMWENHEK